MDSLTNLASSLPAANLANAEKDLMNNFKAAALSITTLYKSSLRTSKRAYNSGYVAACQELLLMIQQGVSTGESSDTNGSCMTIGRIMDYIEARLEAIKSREEEEDEDEEKDRERDRRPTLGTQSKAPLSVPSGPKPSGPVGTSLKLRDFTPSVPMTPLSPPPPVSLPTLLPPTSPSPTTGFRSPQSTSSLSAQRTAKSRLIAAANANVKETMIPPITSLPPALFATAQETPVAIIPASSSLDFPSFSLPSSNETTGTKRRHAAMTAESSSSNTATASSSTSRRRTRSSRILSSAQASDQNQPQPSDAMDVEEDGGRERKRVARR